LRVEDVAEGTRGDGEREATYLLTIAETSLEQTEQLLRSRDLSPLSAARINPLLARTDRIARMLAALKAAVGRTC
jgi:hypothetical protein